MGWRLDADVLGAHGPGLALTGVAPDVDYRRLAGRAAALADALAMAGVEAGDRVAVLSAGRGHDEPVALAGVLCARAVAVPLDTSAPPPRLAALAREAGCRAAVVDDRAMLALRAAGIDVARVELDAQGHVTASLGEAAEVDVAPDPELGCVLYTSGSSGRPKAVPMTWRALDVFSEWMAGLVELAPGTRVLRVAELTFDLSWFDHLATWRAGATLCTVSRRDLTAGRTLMARLRALRPDVIYGVPSLFMKLVATGGPIAAGALCFAGEVYPPAELGRLAAAAPGARLFNLYGPTETNVCTYHEVDRSRLDGVRELPIGRACPYAECRLVAGGAEVEGPGTGELVVRGPTALGGEHATGDRVERGEDGLYYFRGRLDRMLKLRGYRVDPGEIELTLATHPAVREAAVVPRDHPKLGLVLAGYVTLGEAASERDLRKHLSARLPSYMVPESVTVVSELPRTATGKIDHRALATH